MMNLARSARTVQIHLRRAAGAAKGSHMTRDDNEKRTRPTRAQRLVAFGFLGAFGLTILTVLLTGLWVRSPGSHREEPPAVEPPGVEQPVEPNRTTVEPQRAPGAAEPDSARDAAEDQAAQREDSASGRDDDTPPR